MNAPRKPTVEQTDMERLRETFFQLLEADREEAGFEELFHECHRLIGLALEAECRAAAGGEETG